MSMQINKSAYEKLIKEDIEWLLSNTKDSLERRHIVEVLNYSPERLYASGSSETPTELEEAAEEYKQGEIDTNVDYHDETGEPLCFMEALKPAFIAGAKWGRRNLLQEIADGKTHPVDGITAAWLDNKED